MVKVHGHAQILVNLINTNATRPFVWGQWDCCIFAGTAIDAITGRKPSILADWDFNYRSKSGAFKQLKQRGFNSLTELADNYFSQIPKHKAMRGDLALVNGVFGIILNNIYLIGDKGMVAHPIASADVIWQVE